MGKAFGQLPEDFLRRISALEAHADEIVPRVLAAGAAVVLAKVRSRLRAVLSGQSSGELEAALGVSAARLDREGNYNVKVGFAEPRKDGGSNAKLANIIEYGKQGQPPRPFLKPAQAATKAACISTMVAKLEEETGEI